MPTVLIRSFRNLYDDDQDENDYVWTSKYCFFIILLISDQSGMVIHHEVYFYLKII